ncbi:hypothetical protein BDV09DRAFT_165640 [Aspergillus tetrazonus]
MKATLYRTCQRRDVLITGLLLRFPGLSALCCSAPPPPTLVAGSFSAFDGIHNLTANWHQSGQTSAATNVSNV